MNRTSQTFLRSVVRVGTLAIALVTLGGCASYIAHRIANPEVNEIEADLSQIVETNLACSEPHNCIELYALRHSKSHANDEGFSIDLTLSGGNSTTKWTYAGTKEPIATQVLQNELIIIFPGYMMEPQFVVLLQRWLAHITGASVVVAPKPEHGENFTFGLGSVEPIEHFIHQHPATKIHLVGYSMGAIAASTLAKKLDNTNLYLIAPMVSFTDSALALFNKHKGGNAFSWLIDSEDIISATDILFESANIVPVDVNVSQNLTLTRAHKTRIYMSLKDEIVGSNIELPELLRKESDIVVRQYSSLSHIQMMAMLNEALLTDFISDMTDTNVDQNDTKIVGLICIEGQQNCEID